MQLRLLTFNEFYVTTRQRTFYVNSFRGPKLLFWCMKPYFVVRQLTAPMMHFDKFILSSANIMRLFHAANDFPLRSSRP